MGVGLVVTAAAPFYWAFAGMAAIPSVTSKACRSADRAWLLTRLWAAERWRLRHRAARRLREGAKWTNRQRERWRKRLRRLPTVASRLVWRDVPRLLTRWARRVIRVVRPWGGRILRMARRD